METVDGEYRPPLVGVLMVTTVVGAFALLVFGISGHNT